MYLDLLKKTLTHSFWDTEVQPVDPSRTPYFFYKVLVRLAQWFLAPFKLQLAWLPRAINITEGDWSLYAHTMNGLQRLTNIQQFCEQCIAHNIEGDFMECGVWRGGTCIMMQGVLVHNGQQHKRKVIVADSFQGLPKPKYEVDKKYLWHNMKFLSVSAAQVRKHFEAYRLWQGNVEIIEGFFEQSLPKAKIGKLAILRLDADMYCSTKAILINLYDKVSPGGYIVVDDYNDVPACKLAVDDFRRSRGITSPIFKTHRSEVYWLKDS